MEIEITEIILEYAIRIFLCFIVIFTNQIAFLVIFIEAVGFSGAADQVILIPFTARNDAGIRQCNLIHQSISAAVFINKVLIIIRGSSFCVSAGADKCAPVQILSGPCIGKIVIEHIQVILSFWQRIIC